MSMIKITDNKEKRRLLNEMVNFRPALGLEGFEWEKVFITYTINLPVVWTIIKHESIPYQYSEEWEKINGPWKHHGYDRVWNRNSGHNRLGMAYGYWATQTERLSNFALGDSPDFSAKIGEQRVQGDIGICTSVAFNHGIRSLSFHDLWISVYDDDTEILLEPLYAIGSLMVDLVYIDDYRDTHTIEEVINNFFCPSCNEWTISAKSREKIMRKLGVEPNPLQYKLF